MGPAASTTSVRSALGTLRRGLRRVSGELPLVRAAARGNGAAPTVSVVIPVHDVEDYIDACLLSLRAQTHEALQVIVVDDGSTDSSAAIARRHAAEDPRFVVESQANAGQGAARNRGLLRATGRYVTFLDPDDLLPPDAYATMVASLEASGSDFVVGSVRRLWHGTFSSAPWIDQVHDRDRIGTSLEDFPTAVMDVICCNRMLRRSFWEEEGIRFPEGVAYEDHVPMMQAFVRARRFDVLRTVTYHWRTRENLTSTGQKKREVQNLRDRIAAKQQAAALLEETSPRVRDAWLRRVLDLDLHGFVRQLEEADDEYWSVLGAAVRGFLADADDEVLAGVRVGRKLQAWLLAGDHRDALVDLLRWQRENPRDIPTEVRDGQVLACFPTLAAPGAGAGRAGTGVAPVVAPPLPEVPERLRALTAHETRLIASLRGAALDDDGVLELTGWAHPRLVDLAGQDVQVRAVLVQDGSGRRHELPVELREDPEADLFGAHAYQSYAPSGFVTRVDLHEILALTFADEPDQGGPGRLGAWRLELTSAVAGVVRTGALRSRDTRSSAAELPSVRAEDGLAVVPVLDGAEGLRLEVRRPRALLVSLDVTGRAVSGTLRMTGRAGAESRLLDRARGPLQLRFRAAGASTVTADLRANDDGTLAFAAQLPDPDDRAWGDVPRERRLWTVDLVQGRRSERLAWPAGGPHEWWPVTADAALTAQRTERGNVQLRETAHFAVVEDVVLGDDAVVLEGRWLRPAAGAWRPRLVRDGAGEAGPWPAGEVEPTGAAGTGFRCVVPLAVDPWGRGLRPPPAGSWLLELVGDDGLVVRPRLTAALVARTVLRHRAPGFEVELRRGNAHQPVLHVAPPLPVAAAGAHGRRALVERHLGAPAGPVGESVLMQVGDGEHAGDSPLALLRELRRRGDRRRVVWAVSDPSREVPQDAEPVLVGSPGWYDELAVAGSIVLAGDGVPFLRPRPGQQVLQTFRGYPADPASGPWLEDLAPAPLEQALAGARSRWSLVLGAGEHDPLDPATHGYRWTGPRLDAGWPAPRPAPRAGHARASGGDPGRARPRRGRPGAALGPGLAARVDRRPLAARARPGRPRRRGRSPAPGRRRAGLRRHRAGGPGGGAVARPAVAPPRRRAPPRLRRRRRGPPRPGRRPRRHRPAGAAARAGHQRRRRAGPGPARPRAPGRRSGRVTGGRGVGDGGRRALARWHLMGPAARCGRTRRPGLG